jgi:hypothetical protein
MPRIGPPPLWLLFGGPDPRPRWDSGSWPESQSGVGGGTGLGGDTGGCPAAVPFFLAGAAVGTMDSSRVLLVAGSPSSPPLARSTISFLAATLLALDNIDNDIPNKVSNTKGEKENMTNLFLELLQWSEKYLQTTLLHIKLSIYLSYK